MTYAPEFTAKARRAFRDPEPWLQEEVLDEVEWLTHHPDRLVRRGRLPGYVHDFIRERGGTRYYVFLSVTRDDNARVLVVRALGLVVRAGPAGGSPAGGSPPPPVG